MRAILDGLPFPLQHPFLKQPVVIVADSGDCRLQVNAEAGGLDWRLFERDAVVARGRVAGTVINLPPSMAIGTYQLEIDDTDGNTIDSTPLLVTPALAYQGSFDRVWVLSVQLYALSSSRNWGIGDFTDLAALIELTA
ncbi:MAG: 4-alpha-glucanotransferase, partial [Nitrobacter sp.]